VWTAIVNMGKQNKYDLNAQEVQVALEGQNLGDGYHRGGSTVGGKKK